MSKRRRRIVMLDVRNIKKHVNMLEDYIALMEKYEQIRERYDNLPKNPYDMNDFP